MKVTRPPLPPVATLANGARPAASSAPAAGANSAAATAAPGLAQVAGRLAAASEVDLAKVGAVRDAIAAGRLTLDMDRLADAVLELHRR